MTEIEEIEKSMMDDTCERAFLFSPGGNLILPERKDCSGKSQVRFSEEELRLFEGNLLIHSHDNRYGARTFTERDIDLFFRHKLGEIRMVRGNIVKSLVHVDDGNCNHSCILVRLAEFGGLRKGDHESNIEEFLEELLRGNPCLSCTERTLDP
jgi:hypothetical protein